MSLKIAHVWQIQVDDLADADGLFSFIQENEHESIAAVARELDIDELDAIDEFGPGSFWLFEVGASFRVIYTNDIVQIELLVPEQQQVQTSSLQ